MSATCVCRAESTEIIGERLFKLHSPKNLVTPACRDLATCVLLALARHGRSNKTALVGLPNPRLRGDRDHTMCVRPWSRLDTKVHRRADRNRVPVPTIQRAPSRAASIYCSAASRVTRRGLLYNAQPRSFVSSHPSSGENLDPRIPLYTVRALGVAIPQMSSMSRRRRLSSSIGSSSRRTLLRPTLSLRGVATSWRATGGGGGGLLGGAFKETWGCARSLARCPHLCRRAELASLASIAARKLAPRPSTALRTDCLCLQRVPAGARIRGRSTRHGWLHGK